MAFFAQNPKSYHEIWPVTSLRHRGQGLLAESWHLEEPLGPSIGLGLLQIQSV